MPDEPDAGEDLTQPGRPYLAPLELEGELVETWRGGWPRYSIDGEDLVPLLSDLSGQHVHLRVDARRGSRADEVRNEVGEDVGTVSRR